MSLPIPKAKKKLSLVMPVRKTYSQLWEQYGPELSKYYDIERYKSSEMKLKIPNVSKGSNKTIDMEGDGDGNIYAVTSASVAEIEIHMQILVKFLALENPLFDIPRIYKGHSEVEYITSYISFDTEQNSKAKKSKNSIKYCKAEGQFLNFMLNVMNMIPYDVESYVSRAGILTYLDFGEVKVLGASKDKSYLDQYLLDLDPEVVKCIKYNPDQPLA